MLHTHGLPRLLLPAVLLFLPISWDWPGEARQAFVISEVRVFTGTEVIESATVVVRDGKIAAFGRRITVPTDAVQINGRGLTLLPGLIDANTRSNDILETAVMFGVTTELEVSGTVIENDPAALAAMIAAARRGGKRAVVQVRTLQAAKDAFRAGAVGIAPIFSDQESDSGYSGMTAERMGMRSRSVVRRSFIVPTLTLVQAMSGDTAGLSLLGDSALVPFISPAMEEALRQLPDSAVETVRYRGAVRAVRPMHRAGITMLAGSGAGHPGTAHGVSLHHELELLVSTGLTPVEALTAATSAPARMFELNDRGRIAYGLRADLVLVRGDPTDNIRATRAIVSVWRNGIMVDRDSYRARLSARASPGN